MIVNGLPGSGKTTMEMIIKEYFKENLNVCIHSSIDDVKKVAQSIGWDGTKNGKNRKFLSDLKKLLNEFNDFSLQKLCEVYESLKKENQNSLLLIDCREPDEIKKLVKQFNAITLCIKRSSCENIEFSNDSDKNVYNYNYDYYIYNNGSLEELKDKTIKLVMDIYSK